MKAAYRLLHIYTNKGGKDEGSIIPLIAGLCVMLLLIGSVTLAITGAHVQTQRLTDFADAQAAAVARRITKELKGSVSGGAAGRDAQAQAYAAEFLDSSGAAREFDGVVIDSVDISDAQSVHIRLRARIHPPLVSLVVPDGIEIRAYASSRLNTGQE